MVSIDQLAKIKQRRLGKVQTCKTEKTSQMASPIFSGTRIYESAFLFDKRIKKPNQRNHYSSTPLSNFRGRTALSYLCLQGVMIFQIH